MSSFLAASTAGNVDDVLDEILDYQVDGIILPASVALSSDLSNRCRIAGVPNRNVQPLAGLLGYVCGYFRQYAGGRKVAEFLIAGGHERIAFMAGWEGASTQRDREQGFVMVCGMLVCRFLRVVLVISNLTKPAALQGKCFLVTVNRPDAVFVANDHMAFAVMDTLRAELGLAIPDDVSISWL